MQKYADRNDLSKGPQRGDGGTQGGGGLGFFIRPT
jgi:hypothetical protein